MKLIKEILNKIISKQHNFIMKSSVASTDLKSSTEESERLTSTDLVTLSAQIESVNINTTIIISVLQYKVAHDFIIYKKPTYV